MLTNTLQKQNNIANDWIATVYIDFSLKIFSVLRNLAARLIENYHKFWNLQ